MTHPLSQISSKVFGFVDLQVLIKANDEIRLLFDSMEVCTFTFEFWSYSLLQIWTPRRKTKCVQENAP